jgi:FMN reductase
MSIVGLSGNLSNPSRTTTLVNLIVNRIADGAFSNRETLSVGDLNPALAQAADPRQLPAELNQAYAKLTAADVIVIGTPVYKGSYTGLLKHFLDLLDPKALNGKVAVLAATGGSDHHSLVLEHQLRPLLSFFGVHTIPTTVYVKDSDFAKDGSGGYSLDNPEIEARLDTIVEQTLWVARRNNAVQAKAA